MGIRASQADIDRLTSMGATVGPAASLPGPVDDRATVGAIVLCVPWPPSVNHYWREYIQDGRICVALGKRGLAYRKAVEAAAWESRGVKVEGRLAVEIEANPPDKRIRDIDNLLKAVLDSCAHAGLFADDGQIDRITIERGKVVKGGMVQVRITNRKAG